MQNLPFEKCKDGLRLRVRLSPKASRDHIGGFQPDVDGRLWLKVSVTAVPEDGKANKALIKLLSKEWRLPQSTFEVTSGTTDRNKTIVLYEKEKGLEKMLTEYFARCSL